MITERLRAFIESAEQLPADEQEKLMMQIESLLDNARWDMELRSERSLDVLRAMAREARIEPKLPFPTPEEMDYEAQDEQKGEE